MKFYGRETIDKEYIENAKKNIENASHVDKIDYVLYVAPFTPLQVRTNIDSLFIDIDKLETDHNNEVEKVFNRFKEDYLMCYQTAYKEFGIQITPFKVFIYNYKSSVINYCEFMNLIIKTLDTIKTLSDINTNTSYASEMKNKVISVLFTCILKNIIHTKYIYEKVVLNDRSLEDLYISMKDICHLIMNYNIKKRKDLHTKMYQSTQMFVAILRAIYMSIHETYRDILKYDEIIIPKYCSSSDIFDSETYLRIFEDMSMNEKSLNAYSFYNNLNENENGKENDSKIKYVVMGNTKTIIDDEIINKINGTNYGNGLSLLELAENIFREAVDRTMILSYYIPSKVKCALLYQYPNIHLGTIYTKDDEIVIAEMKKQNETKMIVLFSNKDNKNDNTIYGITPFSNKFENNNQIFDIVIISDLDTTSDYVLQ